MHGATVFGQGPVTRDTPDACLPCMQVRIHQPRHDDHAAGIDHIGAWLIDFLPDALDLVSGN